MTTTRTITENDYGLPAPLKKGVDLVYDPLTERHVVSWEAEQKRVKNLHHIQEVQRALVVERLNSLGYEVLSHKRVRDGWGDGLHYDTFEIKDRRDGTIFTVEGNDDNTALFKRYPSGGRGLWTQVPDTVRWFTIPGA